MTLYEHILIETIKIIPSLFWFILICILLKIFYPMIRDDLLPKLTAFEAAGLKFSFVKDALDAAVELAEKSPLWKVDVSLPQKETAINRAKKNIALFRGTKLLWVDDIPENSFNERKMLQKLGASIDISRTTEDAVKVIDRSDYDLVISDMARENRQTAGIDLLNRLQEKNKDIPVIFYIGVVDTAKGVPLGAFGLTNRPDELLHLTLDVLERRAS